MKPERDWRQERIDGAVSDLKRWMSDKPIVLSGEIVIDIHHGKCDHEGRGTCVWVQNHRFAALPVEQKRTMDKKYVSMACVLGFYPIDQGFEWDEITEIVEALVKKFPENSFKIEDRRKA